MNKQQWTTDPGDKAWLINPAFPEIGIVLAPEFDEDGDMMETDRYFAAYISDGHPLDNENFKTAEEAIWHTENFYKPASVGKGQA